MCWSPPPPPPTTPTLLPALSDFFQGWRSAQRAHQPGILQPLSKHPNVHNSCRNKSNMKKTYNYLKGKSTNRYTKSINESNKQINEYNFIDYITSNCADVCQSVMLQYMLKYTFHENIDKQVMKIHLQPLKYYI